MAARCQATPPGTSFLWPQALTVPYGSAFGYIMPLKPANYIELGDFFCIDRNPEAYFRSSTARLNAAIAIADSFSRLHLAGCCYQDINDGNFFADPFTGDILICDNENIVVNGHGHNIAGKPRYMAPEVAAGARPSTASDRLSLAVVLYRIFMTDHPSKALPRHPAATDASAPKTKPSPSAAMPCSAMMPTTHPTVRIPNFIPTACASGRQYPRH